MRINCDDASALISAKSKLFCANGGIIMIRKLDEARKKQLIDILTDELRVLRAKIGLSQQNLANKMGVSRQTYGAIESKKQKMTWSNFLALLLLFSSNDGSAEIIARIGAYPPELKEYIK